MASASDNCIFTWQTVSQSGQTAAHTHVWGEGLVAQVLVTLGRVRHFDFSHSNGVLCSPPSDSAVSFRIQLREESFTINFWHVLELRNCPFLL